MKRTVLIPLFFSMVLWACGETALHASEKQKQKRFKTETALYGGEVSLGLSLMGGKVNGTDSEALLMISNLNANANFLRVSVDVETAYRNNSSIGTRLAYTSGAVDLSNIDLTVPGSDLGLSAGDTRGVLNSFKAVLFHRNYIGLSSKGTVGLFLEEGFSYTHSTTKFGYGDTAITDVRQKVMLSLSPGVILYILPFVSVDISIGIADLSFVHSAAAKQKTDDGSRWQFKAGLKPNLLNLNFGVHYHF